MESDLFSKKHLSVFQFSIFHLTFPYFIQIDPEMLRSVSAGVLEVCGGRKSDFETTH